MKMKVGDIGSQDAQIYINNEKCDLCIEADEEESRALVYVKDFSEHITKYSNSIFQNGEPIYPTIAVIKGKIEIRKRGKV